MPTPKTSPLPGRTSPLTGHPGNRIADEAAVFQPYRTEEGTASIANATQPDDGDTIIVLEFATFAPGESFTFSIDVDEQLIASSTGQIRVSSSENQQASVATLFMDPSGQQKEVITSFNDNAQLGASC